jgi:hypothetical protein
MYKAHQNNAPILYPDRNTNMKMVQTDGLKGWALVDFCIATILWYNVHPHSKITPLAALHFK